MNNNDIARYLVLSLEHNVINKLITLNNMIIRHNIDTINRMDIFIEKVRLEHSDIYKSLNLKEILNNEISQGMKGHCLIRMSLLTFYINSDKFPLAELKLSNVTKKKIQMIHSALKDSFARITKHRLYRILRVADECSFEVAIILSALKRDFSIEYLKRAQDLKRFINKNRVDGYDIQREMNIDQGMQIGQIKEEINRMWFLGKIRTRQEIISFIRSNLT